MAKPDDDWTLAEIADWVGRHRDDDDPPKVATALVEQLLRRLYNEPLVITGEEHAALDKHFTAEER